MHDATHTLRLVITLLIAPHVLAAQASKDSSAENAVRAVIQRYLHGLKFNDTTSLHEAFLPEARLYYTKPDGQLGNGPRPAGTPVSRTARGRKSRESYGLPRSR